MYKEEVLERYPDAVCKVDFINNSNPIYSIWQSEFKKPTGLIGLSVTEEHAWKDAARNIKQYT